ncbi:hypothetical protein QN357_19395 [Cryobacterium sp. RTC2.1]|nr:hypothetical protein [Cryobacterium sp. RTC2.1]MEB0005089.1 hypothetical protein [Cryobacterium sp. RTC2.1]
MTRHDGRLDTLRRDSVAGYTSGYTAGEAVGKGLAFRDRASVCTRA